MRRYVMSFAKRFLATLICYLVWSSPAPAQDLQSAARAGQEMTVIIEGRQVRFTLKKAVGQIQLQVFDQAGEPVFDSGSVAGGEINWSFLNGAGDAVKS